MTRYDVSIEWLDDTYDCETCGAAFADGAIIRIDGRAPIDLIPMATCYDGDSWEFDEVMGVLLAAIDVGLVVDGVTVSPPETGPFDHSVRITTHFENPLEDDYVYHLRADVDGTTLFKWRTQPDDPDHDSISIDHALVQVARHFGVVFGDGALPDHLC